MPLVWSCVEVGVKIVERKLDVGVRVRMLEGVELVKASIVASSMLPEGTEKNH